MANALCDTCVFIDYWRGDPGARRIIEDILARRTTASASPMTTVEIFQSPFMSRQEEIQFRALLLLLEEASFDHAVAEAVGVALRPLSRPQRRKLAADAVIAVTGLVRGEPIYSRNAKDLQRFQATVLTY